MPSGTTPSSVPAVAPAAQPAADAIRIRMYRVGFGDCFLLTLPTTLGPRHILIDCGVHARGDLDTLGPSVDNIAEETGGKLAVVILTHVHQDHLAGFDRFEARFRAFEVGEVWLPWTENPHDADAASLQRKADTVVGQLQGHFGALAAVAAAANTPLTP